MPALLQASLGVRAAAVLSAFAACALWLQRLRESLPAVWRLMGTRVLAQDTELLEQLTQLVWDNAETPVRPGCQRPVPRQPETALPSPGSATCP